MNIIYLYLKEQNINILLKIGHYELVSIEIPPNLLFYGGVNKFHYGFRIPNPDLPDLYLHEDGLFKPLTDHTPFYHNLERIIALFKKCLTK
jgi:hypothetical protein